MHSLPRCSVLFVRTDHDRKRQNDGDYAQGQLTE